MKKADTTRPGLGLTISFLFIFSLCFLPSSLALFEYPNVGGEDENFRLSQGRYNTSLSVTENSVSLTLGVGQPYVLDLDNDSDQEIVVQDSDDLEVYSGRFLQLVDSADMQTDANVTAISNLFFQDIDGDGYTNILYVEDGHNYNGTVHSVQLVGGVLQFSTIPCVNLTLDDSFDDIMIGCNDDDICLIVASDGNPSNHKIKSIAFNASTCGNSATTVVSYSGNTNYAPCLPNIKSIAVGDQDDDGIDEFVYSFVRHGYYSTGAGTQLANYVTVRVVSVSSALVETAEHSDSFSMGTVNTDTAEPNCVEDNLQVAVSPITLMDVDGTDDALEALFASKVPSGWRIFAVDDDNTLLDEFPEAVLSPFKGEYVSNVVVANTFHDTGIADFCAMGFNKSTAQIGCGSKQSSFLFENVQWESPNHFQYNLSGDNNDTRRHLNMIHAVDYDDTETSGNDLDEFLTPFGIFVTDWTGGSGDEDGTTTVYNITKVKASTIQVDAEETGFEDLILMTRDNLYYMEDNFSNTGCELGSCIQEITFNPCVDNQWLENTTVRVTVTAQDADGDNLSMRVVAYANDANEQDSGFGNNRSSPSTENFDFKANQSVTGGILKVMARDTGVPSSVEVRTFTFNVNETGVSFGEVVCTKNYEAEDVTAEAGVNETDYSDNVVTNTLNSFAGESGLGTAIIFWLCVLALLWGIWHYGSEANAPAQYSFGAMILAFMLSTFIGFKLGLIGAGIMITFVTVMILGVAITLGISIFSRPGG